MEENKKAKKKKRAKHTHLVVPGVDVPKKKTAKRPAVQPGPQRPFAPEEEAQDAAAAKKEQDANAPDARTDVDGADAPAQDEKQTEAPAANEQPGAKKRGGRAIHLPRVTPGVARSRRRKRWKRIRAGIALALVALVVVFFASGLYLSFGVVLSEAAESARIALQGGPGFPVEFTMTGYHEAQGMGGGFAVLGEKELSLVAANGKELRRVQHNYMRPAVSTGKNRACLYNRGKTEYTIEGRSKTLYRGVAEQEIVFMEMSRNGRYALCTSSRYQTTIQVYGPTLAWEWTWKTYTDTPIMASFGPDNKTLAVGCVAAEDGVLNSAIRILRPNRDIEKAQVGLVQVNGAIPLQMQYLSKGRLLVLYNQGYAAVYNNAGEELARYEYGGRALAAADVGADKIALLFGSDAQGASQLVLLDKTLQPLMEAQVAGVAGSKLLAAKGGVFLLAGQQITAYSTEGELVESRVLENRAYGLVHGNKPVLLVAGLAMHVDDMLLPPEERAPESGSVVPASGTA